MDTALLRHFVRQDLVDRHASSVLGAGWVFLLPLANILIFTLVFSKIMGTRLQVLGLEQLGEYSYSIYLVIGLLAWNCFAGTVLRTTQVFQDKAALINRVKLGLLSLPLYIVVSELLIYVISMAIFCVFLAVVGFEWTAFWLWLPVIVAVQQLLAYSLGLLFAIVGVFLKDIKDAVAVIMQLWFWLTPVVYVMSIIPEDWTAVFIANPLYHTTSALRDALIQGVTPDLTALTVIVSIASALLTLTLVLGKRLERDIRDFI